MEPKFKEEQRFTQWWLWLILIGIGILPVIGIYERLVSGKKFGTNPMSDIYFILFSIFVFGLVGMFFFIRLKTEIDEKEIRINFIPFLKKQVSWKEIKSAEVLNYGFVGGWGIRLGTEYGTVYNTKGNKGLAIELKNGKRFLIGTQNESEMKKVLKDINLSSNE